MEPGSAYLERRIPAIAARSVQGPVNRWLTKPNRARILDRMSTAKRKPGGGPLTPEQYELMLEVYRQHPGKHTAASKASGVSRNTCRKAWTTGLHYAWSHRRPLRDVIGDEQDLTRQALTNLGQGKPSDLGTRLAAQQQAVMTRTETAKGLAQARHNVGALLNVVGSLTGAATALAEHVEAKLQSKGRMSAKAALVHLRNISIINRNSVVAAKATAELEQLLLGDKPPELDAADMTDEQAVDTIKKATAALERCQASGLVLVEGGKKEAV